MKNIKIHESYLQNIHRNGRTDTGACVDLPHPYHAKEGDLYRCQDGTVIEVLWKNADPHVGCCWVKVREDIK